MSISNQTIHCYEPGKIEVVDIPYPTIEDKEVVIKSVYTGICRTDVDIFEGKAPPLPFGMFGHEGFGLIVDAVPSLECFIGSYAASRADMAYAKYFKSSWKDISPLFFVKEPSPEFIIEPLACAKNIADHVKIGLAPILILGTGFLSQSVKYYLRQRVSGRVDVLANNHKVDNSITKDQCDWSSYRTIIDCSGNIEIPIEKLMYNTHLIMASKLQYSMSTDFSNHLWKALKLDFPSPRSEIFTMKNIPIPNFAADYWTHTDTFENAQALFEASVNRDKNFRRSYITYE